MKITVVGAGISGLTAARICKDAGHDVTVFETKGFIGGACAIDEDNNPRFGAHILHTNNRMVWEFIAKYCSIKKYDHYVIARTDAGEVPVPFNYWSELLIGKKTDEELLNLIFRHYTMRQWGISYDDLPEDTRKRVKVRRGGTDCRYFTDLYQGIPDYKQLFTNLRKDIDVLTGVAGGDWRNNDAELVFYSGCISDFSTDECLQYRTCDFEESKITTHCPVLNNCTSWTNERWTRIHNFRSMGIGSKSMMETPRPCKYGEMRLYPLTVDEKQVNKYNQLMRDLPIHCIPIGRVAKYLYLDMDDAIYSTMILVNSSIK